MASDYRGEETEKAQEELKEMEDRLHAARDGRLRAFADFNRQKERALNQLIPQFAATGHLFHRCCFTPEALAQPIEIMGWIERLTYDNICKVGFAHDPRILETNARSATRTALPAPAYAPTGSPSCARRWSEPM